MSGAGRALLLPDEAATLAAGARLAAAVRGEEGPLVVALSGGLGSGKTTLVRGLLRALGASGAIRSPSYTLVEEHAVRDWEVLHVDLYRLAEGESLQEFGLRDRHAPHTLQLIEWPERASAGGLPPVDLTIELSISADGHRLTAHAGSARGTRLLTALLVESPDDSRLSS